MKDVQSELSKVKLPIKKVGIKELVWPIKIQVQGEVQSTVAHIDMSVDLAKDVRGTHMSRFVESLQNLDIINKDKDSIIQILNLLKVQLDAQQAYIRIDFPFFIYKAAPVSGKTAPVDIRCSYIANLADSLRINTLLQVPINTLCPCSKEISKYGAHNQRAIVSLEICNDNDLIELSELVKIAEAGASTPIYSLLKRIDEQYVTELAYENPQFVEDAVRQISIILEDMDLSWYKVSVESIESIHNHNAFACIEKNCS